MDTDGNNFTNIYSFTTNNQGGVHPQAGLVLDGTNFFGTTSGGGAGYGTVFKIDTNGGGYSNVYVFTNGPDGGNPLGGLVLSQGALYGVAYGGSNHYGVVFKINVDGSGFTNIHSFSYVEAGPPIGRLTISGNTLYGSTASEMFGNALFKVNTDGSGFTLLGSSGSPGLALLGNTLYGTRGDFDFPGGIYKIHGEGSRFVYNFTNVVVPQGDLISSGGIVYGTTYEGPGTVFAFNPAIPLRAATLNTNIVLEVILNLVEN